MESWKKLLFMCVLLSCLVVSDSLQLHGLVAHQAPLSMRFSRKEYWSGLPFPSPGNLPDPRIEPGSSDYRQILYHLSQEGRSQFWLHVGNCFIDLLFSAFVITVIHNSLPQEHCPVPDCKPKDGEQPLQSNHSIIKYRNIRVYMNIFLLHFSHDLLLWKNITTCIS